MLAHVNTERVQELDERRVAKVTMALRAHVNSGQLSEETLHAELGKIVAGIKPGRESAAETNLFWHRGLSLSDIALGHALLQKAQRLGVGQRLRFY